MPPWTGSWLPVPETRPGTQQVLKNCLWDEGMDDWKDGQAVLTLHTTRPPR